MVLANGMKISFILRVVLIGKELLGLVGKTVKTDPFREQLTAIWGEAHEKLVCDTLTN